MALNYWQVRIVSVLRGRLDIHCVSDLWFDRSSQQFLSHRFWRNPTDTAIHFGIFECPRSGIYIVKLYCYVWLWSVDLFRDGGTLDSEAGPWECQLHCDVVREWYFGTSQIWSGYAHDFTVLWCESWHHRRQFGSVIENSAAVHIEQLHQFECLSIMDSAASYGRYYHTWNPAVSYELG